MRSALLLTPLLFLSADEIELCGQACGDARSVGSIEIDYDDCPEGA